MGGSEKDPRDWIRRFLGTKLTLEGHRRDHDLSEKIRRARMFSLIVCDIFESEGLDSVVYHSSQYPNDNGVCRTICGHFGFKALERVSFIRVEKDMVDVEVVGESENSQNVRISAPAEDVGSYQREFITMFDQAYRRAVSSESSE